MMIQVQVQELEQVQELVLADGVVELPTFTSSSTFVVDEGVTAIGVVSATLDAAGTDVTFTIGATTGPATLVTSCFTANIKHRAFNF